MTVEIQIPPTRTQRLREQTIAGHVVRPPQAMYDIGVGPKSEWWSLAQVWPEMATFGCEPNPAMYAAILDAGFPGPLAQVAIGENEGPQVLYSPIEVPHAGSLYPRDTFGPCEAIQVNVWSLDRFDGQMGRPPDILLWLDIEGNELNALHSGRRLLASGRVRWINVELRCQGHVPPGGWSDPREVHELLARHGYDRVNQYDEHPTHHDVIYRHHQEPCHADSTGPLSV